MPDLFGKLKSGANKVAFEADKLARVNRASGEADKLKAQINSQMSKLGELVFQKFSNQETVDPDLAEICQGIAQVQEQVTAKNEEIARIKAETYVDPQAAPAPAPAAVPAAEPAPDGVEPQAQAGARFCPNCGKEVESSEKFCKECGTRL